MFSLFGRSTDTLTEIILDLFKQNDVEYFYHDIGEQTNKLLSMSYNYDYLPILLFDNGVIKDRCVVRDGEYILDYGFEDVDVAGEMKKKADNFIKKYKALVNK